MGRFIFLVSVSLLSSFAFAQEVVTPRADLPIRESPPGTFFEGKGAQIGTANPGDEYRVLEKRDVPTIVGVEKWLKVAPLDDPAKSGWAYGGTGSETKAFTRIDGGSQ